MNTSRRLHALETETARLAQVAQARNRAALLNTRSLMPPHLLAALSECERLWGNDRATLARHLAALLPPGAGLDPEPDPATCPAAAWMVAAGLALDDSRPLPQPPQGTSAALSAQAAQWEQLAQAHAGKPLGKLALYRQADLTMGARLAETLNP